MQELDDIALLRQYTEKNSEEAFAALVSRHINKVYSVALRNTRNPHQAEEITQAVFVILANKSRHLGKSVVLSGWLYQTARLTTLTFIRSEIRRARREQEACMENLLNQNASDVWPQIAPLLDAAMAGLNETDRHAVVLRFFDGKSMREVGAALGSSEDAAKVRLNRAVEKLRRFFAKRGVATSAAVLTAMISANSVQAAPVTLAKSATALAFTKGATASTSALTLIKGALKVMAWTKMKSTIVVVAASVILTISMTTVLVSLVKPTTLNFAGQPVTVLKEFDWQDVAKKGQLAGGKVMKLDGKTVLKITGASNGVALPLLKIEKPPITAMHYAVIGEIKYENVEGAGHVNMWSFFQPVQSGSAEAQYYSYTGDVGLGPAARIQGDSNWRAFFLPLDRTGKTYPESFVPPMDTAVTLRAPMRLEVGIFLGSRGTVYLRELKLVQWK